MLVEVFGFSPELMHCPDCRKVINLLERKGIEYTFHSVIMGIHKGRFIRDDVVSLDIMERMKLAKGSNIVVPQVFVNGTLIGGYWDLDRFLVDIPVVK